MARKALSPKTRFDVFKRDGFVCQYCGAHPPSVVLHVDHIVAVARGGENSIDNLITSCERCNIGKGAGDLQVAPMSLPEKAALVSEKEAQLKGYHEVMESARKRVEDEIWEVVREFNDQADKINRDYFQSIKNFIGRLGFHEVLEAMEIARAKKPYSENQRFRYFCGVCWKKIKDAETGE